jgi:hypothetical protein
MLTFLRCRQMRAQQVTRISRSGKGEAMSVRRGSRALTGHFLSDAFTVKLVNELVEHCLLLQAVNAGRPRRNRRPGLAAECPLFARRRAGRQPSGPGQPAHTLAKLFNDVFNEAESALVPSGAEGHRERSRSWSRFCRHANRILAIRDRPRDSHDRLHKAGAPSSVGGLVCPRRQKTKIAGDETPMIDAGARHLHKGGAVM